jgi:hypothetical protein
MPDPPTTALVSARATAHDDGRVTFYTRSHRAEVGVPMSFDIEEPRLTAVEQFVAAIGADVLGGLARLGRRERLRLDEIEASIEAVIADPLVFLGVVGESGRPRVTRVAVRTYVGTGEPVERVQRIWDEALRRAPLVNTLRPVVDLDLQWQRAG